MIEAMLAVGAALGGAGRGDRAARTTGSSSSAKVSGVRDLVDVYRLLAARCDYPLHLGLTEAGMGDKGIVASTAGLAILLNEGIGDTIRVSLTPEPGAPREREVEVAQQVLQSMGLRSFLPQVSACPGCGRTTSTFFQEMAQQIQTYLREQMPVWRETHPGVEELRVAVMGCVVNGPGESKHADIGISLPGTFEEPVAPVFIDGKPRSDAAWRRPRRRVHRASSRTTSARRYGSRPGEPAGGAGLDRRRAPAAIATPGPTYRDEPVRDPSRSPSRRRRGAVSLSVIHALRVYTSGATERPLRDVGDPHVSFSSGRA